MNAEKRQPQNRRQNHLDELKRMRMHEGKDTILNQEKKLKLAKIKRI